MDLHIWRFTSEWRVIMQRPHSHFIENFNELGIIGDNIYYYACIYQLKIELDTSILNFGLICFIVVSLFSFPQERIIPSLLFFTLVSYKLQNKNSIPD